MLSSCGDTSSPANPLTLLACVVPIPLIGPQKTLSFPQGTPAGRSPDGEIRQPRIPSETRVGQLAQPVGHGVEQHAQDLRSGLLEPGPERLLGSEVFQELKGQEDGPIGKIFATKSSIPLRLIGWHASM